MATHIMRLVKSKAARDEDFDLVVMKMTSDAKNLADRHKTTVKTESPCHGTAEIGIAEGVAGPSLHEYKRHMEPSFGKHCSRVFPEIDLTALEVFTK